MAVNSKQKGNSFELKTAKILSERFEQIIGVPKGFRRNIDSGSYFGGKNQGRIATHGLEKAEFGDIISPANFKFEIECKHYKTPPSFSMMLNQDCKMIDEWIKKAEQDSINAGKDFMIIMKFNNVVESVVLDKLFGNLVSVMNYKKYFIVKLEDLLAQDDSHFFS